MSILYSRFWGLGLYWFVGFGAGYLLINPILGGPFGVRLWRTVMAWAVAVFILTMWSVVYWKESQERSLGKVPPFSGRTPRLALMILLFGVIVGSTLAVFVR